ncbi:hypothetical protein PM10SUCC1_19460 [Propionigenium maris DSM 9537]|uniref:Uncharacterized protein n=1 Tax=Propionigenium maris DSM 9537 TaxID=1123000 RepID=A0A9W6LNA6_9FUSO|nr:hypothetical protein [Propionigenium maris]GLI56432.1 hypothetical protein PM10SUCC1_19460 [Propionigenium maris DSM 9537]
MKFNLLKGAAEIKLRSVNERRIYEYLETFKVKELQREERVNLGSEEMQIRSFESKGEIKRGVRDGFVVAIDCFNRYFICLSKRGREQSIYLLKIQFDLDEIFGREAADLMDLREEKVLGAGIGIEEAETLIDNYLEWMKEREEHKEEAAKEKVVEDRAEKDIENEELKRWFEV